MMNEIFVKWAGALSWELQSSMQALRDSMEERGDEWGSTYDIKAEYLDELEHLSLIERKSLGSAAEFTSLGSNIVNYCTC